MPAFSTYAILLDFQQGRCGGGNICLHRYGSLILMRGWNNRPCNGQVAAWPEEQFDREDIEPINMHDLAGNDLPGVIAKLSYRASMAQSFAMMHP